jgi:hypothetical protein
MNLEVGLRGEIFFMVENKSNNHSKHTPFTKEEQ